MNLKNRTVYDFELMEELNSYLVISMVLPGLPSLRTGSGRNFSFLEQLPVTYQHDEPFAAPGV